MVTTFSGDVVSRSSWNNFRAIRSSGRGTNGLDTITNPVAVFLTPSTADDKVHSPMVNHLLAPSDRMADDIKANEDNRSDLCKVFVEPPGRSISIPCNVRRIGRGCSFHKAGGTLVYAFVFIPSHSAIVVGHLTCLG
ncbi:hypothetical protein S40285_09944 [Stachybotrys chlorohalonatus IBT 40285]|uniref:Uncharacterized protein n=1 Tax=Stachybotrys chlorohalonatus (strain IBT 40285) TaxID=1283841 RepID=A0A084QHG0_STAC4|nr:hypothetical protein S40285_09944 [Stachybotrys chlorohalonata IBT 40285]